MKEILCFGDSNTYGIIPGTTSRFDRDTRWTGTVESELFSKSYKIVEEGLCELVLQFLKMNFVTTDVV